MIKPNGRAQDQAVENKRLVSCKVMDDSNVYLSILFNYIFAGIVLVIKFACSAANIIIRPSSSVHPLLLATCAVEHPNLNI